MYSTRGRGRFPFLTFQICHGLYFPLIKPNSSCPIVVLYRSAYKKGRYEMYENISRCFSYVQTTWPENKYKIFR